MQIFRNDTIPDRTRSAVNTMASLGRIPQSVMLTGGTEALRLKCAYELASAVLCKEKNAPCGKCPNCKKALAQVHCDITLIEPTENRKLVSIDDIRTNVIEKLWVMPNESDNKVFILTDASDYSVYIQNCLLKSIEEPPEDTLFILLCNGRNDMLSTIISRSVELYLGEAPEGKQKTKDNKSNEIAAEIAKGISRKNEYLIVEESAKIGKDRDLFDKTINRLITIIRDALVCESGAGIQSDNENLVFSIADNCSPVCLIKIKDALDSIAYKNSINCNVNLSIALMTSLIGKLLKEY